MLGTGELSREAILVRRKLEQASRVGLWLLPGDTRSGVRWRTECEAARGGHTGCWSREPTPKPVENGSKCCKRDVIRFVF